MLVVGFDIATKFGRKHRDAMGWLNQFRETAQAQSWTSLTDVRRSFPRADGVKLVSGIVVMVFNVKGNEYRLLTRIKYAIEVVEILDVLTLLNTTKTGGSNDTEEVIMKTRNKSQPDVYLKLVREFPLKTIRTAAEHKAAMRHPLFARSEASLNTDELEYLRVLATLIEQYESRAFPVVKSPVHERLRFLIEESGMGQAVVGRLLGVGQPAVSMILSGKRGLTVDAVKRLADHFRVSPSYFIG